MYLILFGAPGVGKGTQAKMISSQYSIPQISTGDILRDAIKNNTELGEEAKKYMEHGQLVPDDLILKIIKERCDKNDCHKGFILDGFPRTITQAEGLAKLNKEANLPPFVLVEIVVPDEVIIKRLSSRKTCSACGADYNAKTTPAPANNICTQCGGKITTRHDDDEKTIQKRLKVYREQTAPVKHFYEKQGRFISINGNRSVEEVNQEIILALKPKPGSLK